MAVPRPSRYYAPAPSFHPATRRWVTGLEQGKDGSLTPKGQYYVDWSKQVSQPASQAICCQAPVFAAVAAQGRRLARPSQIPNLVL